MYRWYVQPANKIYSSTYYEYVYTDRQSHTFVMNFTEAESNNLSTVTKHPIEKPSVIAYASTCIGRLWAAIKGLRINRIHTKSRCHAVFIL